MPNPTDHEILIAPKTILPKIKNSLFCFKLSYFVFILLINVKISMSIGNLTYKSMINSMVSLVEFYNLETGAFY